MKHIEILPFLLNNYTLFDGVLVETELRIIGLDSYVILKCNINPKQLWWYLKEAKNEPNFININISDFIEFKFKSPQKYNWYIPIVFNSGLNVIHNDHTFKYFINKNNPGYS